MGVTHMLQEDHPLRGGHTMGPRMADLYPMQAKKTESNQSKYSAIC
jgi:hypothetical protein